MHAVPFTRRRIHWERKPPQALEKNHGNLAGNPDPGYWSMVYKGEWVYAPDLWTSYFMERNVIKEKQGMACYSTSLGEES